MSEETKELIELLKVMNELQSNGHILKKEIDVVIKAILISNPVTFRILNINKEKGTKVVSTENGIEISAPNIQLKKL